MALLFLSPIPSLPISLFPPPLWVSLVFFFLGWGFSFLVFFPPNQVEQSAFSSPLSPLFFDTLSYDECVVAKASFVFFLVVGSRDFLILE